MKDASSSFTALLPALLRAAHQILDDTPRILNDPVAIGLVDGSSALTLSGQVVVGQNVQVFISGGTHAEDYALLCKITDSDGQIHEGDATLRVLEE